MKKRIILIMVMCLLASSTVVMAKDHKSIKVAIAKLVIYYNNTRVNSKVLTYKNVNYIPVSVLSDTLDYVVTIQNKRLTITESTNTSTLEQENYNLKQENYNLKQQNSNLEQQNYNLQQENTKLKTQIVQLQEALNKYNSGTPTTPTQTEDAYLKSLINATTMDRAVYPFVRNKFLKTPRDTTGETWYKIDLTAGQGISVALKAQIDKGSMDLALYNKDKYVLDYDGLSNGQYGTVNYKASVNTTIYLKVTGSKGIYYLGFYDHYYNNTSAGKDERDFFGTLFLAKKLVSATFTRNEATLPEYYRVDVKEGQTLTVNLSSQIDKGTINIGLYDKDEYCLDYDYSYHNRMGVVSKKASRDCTYYVLIEGAAGKYSLNYTLTY